MSQALLTSTSPRPWPAWLDLRHRSRGELLVGGLRVLVPLTVLLLADLPAALGVLLFQEGGILLARWLSGSSQTALRFFYVAYGVRFLVAIPVHVVRNLANGNGAVFQDDYTYDLVGSEIIRYIQGDGVTVFLGQLHLLTDAYTFQVAVLYGLFTHQPLVPKMLNVVLAGLCVVLLYDITRRTFGSQAARLAGFLAALLPSTIVWSILTEKEMTVFFCVLVALRACLALSEAPLLSSRCANAAVAVIAVLPLVGDLRPGQNFLLVGTGLLIVGGRVLARFGWRRTALIASVGVACAVVVVLGAHVRAPGSRLAQMTNLAAINNGLRYRRASEALNARTGFVDPSQIVNDPTDGVPRIDEVEGPFNLAQDVLQPLGFGLLAPAPWQVQTLKDVPAAAEQILVYAILIGVLVAWKAPRRSHRFLFALAAYGVAAWVALAISEGNLGNLLRHRLILWPVLIVLGSGGWAWLWPSVPVLPAVTRGIQQRAPGFFNTHPRHQVSDTPA